jgi:hypothetical protein
MTYNRMEAKPGAYAALVDVSGTTYVDMGVTRLTPYCYRARYLTGSAWTEEACMMTGCTP